MMANFPDANGYFRFWTSINRLTLTEWADENRTYPFPDIVEVVEKIVSALPESTCIKKLSK